MSDQTKRYILKVLDNDKENVISQYEYESEKDFCKALKKSKSKKIAISAIIDGSEVPMYLVRKKVVFRNSDGNVLYFNIENGKLFEENKHSIVRDKEDRKDKYIIKKDEDSYYRYSTNGQLIDSIRKKHFIIITLIVLIIERMDKEQMLKYLQQLVLMKQ